MSPLCMSTGDFSLSFAVSLPAPGRKKVRKSTGVEQRVTLNTQSDDLTSCFQFATSLREKLRHSRRSRGPELNAPTPGRTAGGCLALRRLRLPPGLSGSCVSDDPSSLDGVFTDGVGGITEVRDRHATTDNREHNNCHGKKQNSPLTV